ncbi:MAG: OFA family MFS transporter [Nanoarchaeota archaeon]|nr:OFA family MFS transporter [Nanoarchaeota archaeon]
MGKNKIINRWFVVFGAILIQLALGAIYAWSAFTKELIEAPYNFTTPQTQAIFSAGLFTFALVMIFAGIWMKKVGPRALAIAGGIVLGVGYILGGLFGSSFITQLIFIGIIGGAGIGLAYVVPIAVSMKWFPDKKGLISGLAVAGFGFGATIWVKLAGSWFGGLLNTINIFGLTSVQGVFFIYGAAFAIMVLIGSIWMVNPPEDYKVESAKAEAKKETNTQPEAASDLTWKNMLGKYSFWATWLIFIFSGLAGLMVIGTIKFFGIDTLTGTLGIQAAGVAAGTAMAWYAIFNGLGRIVWGKVSDSLGPKMSIFLMCLIQGILMLTFFNLGVTPIMLIIYASAIGFNFGGNFALFPVATAKLFGTKNVGSNYPFVFTAYGIAGIAGPMLGGFVRAETGSFLLAFIPAGIACLVGAVVALTIKTKKE